MSGSGMVVRGPLGRVELTGTALASLVARSAATVPEIRVRRPRRGIEVVVGPASIHVQVAVEGAVGSVLPELGKTVQRAVAEAVSASTGLETSVDVVFEDLT